MDLVLGSLLAGSRGVFPVLPSISVWPRLSSTPFWMRAGPGQNEGSLVPCERWLILNAHHLRSGCRKTVFLQLPRDGQWFALIISCNP